MKNFANVKMVCAIALCLSLLITLCSCGDTSPSSSESDSAAQTTSSEKQNEASSEAAVTSDTSVDKEDETPSKSSKPSSVTTSNISSKPIKPATTTSTTPTPKTPAQLILGKWRGSADIAPLLVEQGYAVEGEQLVSCDIEFASGGILYETIDRASFKNAFTNALIDVLNDELASKNLTKEEFEASIGKTFDEYLNQVVQVTMELIPKTIISAYKFVGNDLYVRDQEDDDFEKEEYSFSGENKLTILDGGTYITYTRIS